MQIMLMRQGKPQVPKGRSVFVLSLFCLTVLLSAGTGPAWAAEKAYYHLVVLGDPHLPGKHLEQKELVIKTINAWDDVDLVVPVGDLCEDRGLDTEYAEVKNFFKKLNKPLSPITGNHDFIYEERLGPKERRLNGSAASRAATLRKFQETFGLSEVFYSKRMGNYLLIFLSANHLESDNLTEMSTDELKWLRAELGRNKRTPTIIFFHAPLKGVLRNYTRYINTPIRVAQPSDKIHDLLKKNPQVFLWVSGHTHTPPSEESFASAINVYDKRVMNIHNADMKRETIYTNSLYLYPDKAKVKTYNHKKSVWLPEFERTIALPAL